MEDGHHAVVRSDSNPESRLVRLWRRELVEEAVATEAEKDSSLDVATSGRIWPGVRAPRSGSRARPAV